MMDAISVPRPGPLPVMRKRDKEIGELRQPSSSIDFLVPFLLQPFLLLEGTVMLNVTPADSITSRPAA